MSELHEYPYTCYEDDCGFMCHLLMKAGVKLATVGNKLQLLNKNNFVLSEVTVSYAETAAKDTEGNNISAYLISAGASGNTLVVTNGAGTDYAITIPYATKAEYDTENQKLTSYLRNFTLDGNQVKVTLGDGSSYNLTIPFATIARTDVAGKTLTSYAASLVVDGNKLVLKNGNGNTINEITVPYATNAGTADVAEKAENDLNGNAILSNYAGSLKANASTIELDAKDGTKLSEITVPFATLATDATNAVETVQIVGNEIVFTTYGGIIVRCTIPYSLKALGDKEGNDITETYVANVVQDPVTGEINFYAEDGSTICSLTPSARVAEYDTYDNLIADYIKTLVFDNQSDYLVATHGDGTVDSIVINYSNTAWKDTQDNIIKNVYVKNLVNEADGNGQWVIVAYNGSNQEIFRFIVHAEIAEKDSNGTAFVSGYVSSISYVAADNQIIAKSPDNTTLATITLPAFATIPTYVYNKAYFTEETGKIKHQWRNLNLYDTNGNLIDTWGNEEVDTVKDLSFLNVVKVDNPTKDIVSGFVEPKEYLADTLDGEIAVYKPVINNATIVYSFTMNSNSTPQGNAYFADRGNPIGYSDPGNTRFIPQTYEKTILKPWSYIQQTINANSTGTVSLYLDNYNGLLNNEIIEMSFVNIPELKIDSWTFTQQGNNLLLDIDVTNTTASNYTVNADTVEVYVEINPYKNVGFDWKDTKERVGQIQKTWDIYVDFDNEVDNTIKISYADFVTLVPGWSIPGDIDYPGPKVKLSEKQPKYINEVRVIKKENSPDRTMLNYYLSNGTSFTVMNSDNTLEVAKINFVEGYGSFTYESANDDINYLEDGDIIQFGFGDSTNSTFGFYIIAIVKK